MGNCKRIKITFKIIPLRSWQYFLLQRHLLLRPDCLEDLAGIKEARSATISKEKIRSMRAASRKSTSIFGQSSRKWPKAITSERTERGDLIMYRQCMRLLRHSVPRNDVSTAATPAVASPGSAVGTPGLSIFYPFPSKPEFLPLVPNQAAGGMGRYDHDF
jgi:hypothetical protein